MLPPTENFTFVHFCHDLYLSGGFLRWSKNPFKDLGHFGPTISTLQTPRAWIGVGRD
jgi:hypothetical protein